MAKQVKSKQRVADHGEVFTAEREVKAMCDLVADECLRINSRFLEPACGDGNFLAEILTRKLSVVKSKYKKSAHDYERNAILALASIYGVDILSDNAAACRERTLKDVITQLEPGLFKKVTGLDVPDFEMLCTLGVFNASLMNDAIFKFKRYEDSSLSYTGIDKHAGMDIGGWDTVLKKAEYDQLFYNRQATMQAPVVEQPEDVDDVVPIKKPDPAPKPKTTYITGQYGVKPTASMVAEKPASYGAPKPTAPTQPSKKEEPKLDLSGVVKGATVIHKSFGAGTVTSLDKAKKHIRVKFNVGEKTFIFPDAFKNGFLKAK